MSGFVYIWYDLKRKMFYVGSHWGSQSDGYVCSSVRMMRAFRKRRESFKRRIIAVCPTSRVDLLVEEQRWLQMIPDKDLGTKYYNLHKRTGHWHGSSDRARVIEKLKLSWTEDRKEKAKRTQTAAWTEERRTKFRLLTVGRKRSNEAKEKMQLRWTPFRKEQSAERLRLVTQKRFANYWDNHLTCKEKLARDRKLSGYVVPDRKDISKAQWEKRSIEQKIEVCTNMAKASMGKVPIINHDGVIKRVLLADLPRWLADGWVRGRTLTPSAESLRKRTF